jgi:hypothetical protein
MNSKKDLEGICLVFSVVISLRLRKEAEESPSLESNQASAPVPLPPPPYRYTNSSASVSLRRHLCLVVWNLSFHGRVGKDRSSGVLGIESWRWIVTVSRVTTDVSVPTAFLPVVKTTIGLLTNSKYVHSAATAVPLVQHVLRLHLQDVLLLWRSRNLEQLRASQLHDVVPL